MRRRGWLTTGVQWVSDVVLVEVLGHVAGGGTVLQV